MENYRPRHNDYSPLRALHEEQQGQEPEEPVQEQASVQNEATIETQSPEPEPIRPEGRYVGYAQGEGDYVSETMAAVHNDTQVVNRDYHASMAAERAAGRDSVHDAVEEELKTLEGQDASVARDPEVIKTAQAYAEAHPDSGATEEQIYDAAYFAHSVDDPETYPPRNEEEKNLMDERQSYEAIDRVLAERSGEECDVSAEQEQAQIEDRMQAHLGFQQQMSMSM